ncbi:MAG TPA: hypothetical protein VE985_00590 [Gaiellaceae bacterium]|nr:hypothetical protein [Gaiellaceae bacterium]
MPRWLLAVAVACGTAALGFAAATAVSAAPTAQSAQTTMRVGFKLGKFVQRGHRLVALGSVTATATTPDGASHSVTKPFTARVLSRGFRHLAARTCSVLSLQLDQLSLTLLGLNVDLGKVILSIKGEPNGGALGSLFCQLARAKVKLRSLASYSRHLTSVVHRSGLATSANLLGFSVPVKSTQQSAAAGTCPILDLILGPLHLDLLGLVVDLNQVHLSITATPNGGVLGSLFCSLAGSTATAPTTT